ncbi:MAG: alpha/beta hydrolase [Pseudomonadota bacterium]
MSQLETFALDSAGVHLNVYALGPVGAPPVLMLHGIRDVALSLLPVAKHLARDFRVFLMDLRGHGRSDRPGVYSMAAMLFDVMTVVDSLAGGRPAIFGHSLGGQITARFAATFPDRAGAAIVVEGLGPPPPDGGTNPRALLDREARRIQSLIPAHMRTLPDLEYATGRLLKNNPRLSPAHGRAIAQAATEPAEDGRLAWAFDPRAQSVFLASREARFYWPLVECPVMLGAGALAHEYWTRAIPLKNGWDGRFATGELEAIAAMFSDAELVHFEHSGHMVHYDEPDALAEATRAFLERRFVPAWTTHNAPGATGDAAT